MNNELIEYVSKIDELVNINKFIDDDSIEEAMNYLVKLSVRQDFTEPIARMLIVKLQAIGSTCAIRAMYYSHFDKGRVGTDQNLKKNFYYTMSAELDKVANSLKYYVRQN